MQQLFIDV